MDSEKKQMVEKHRDSKTNIEAVEKNKNSGRNINCGKKGIVKNIYIVKKLRQ